MPSPFNVVAHPFGIDHRKIKWGRKEEAMLRRIREPAAERTVVPAKRLSFLTQWAEGGDANQQVASHAFARKPVPCSAVRASLAQVTKDRAAIKSKPGAYGWTKKDDRQLASAQKLLKSALKTCTRSR